MSVVLDNKTRQLIAVGASMASNCVSCLHQHYNAAMAAGASVEEIIEAIKIGEVTKAQPSAQIKQEIVMLLNEQGNPFPSHHGGKKSCGCGCS